MKNVAINNLTYTGVVTLSQYVGNKKIQIAKANNTGGTSLFKFLANCLVGDFTYAKASCPTKIKLLNRYVVENGFEYESFSGFIFKRGVEVIEDNVGECRVRYSFMIPRDLLENITSITTLGLGLYANGVPESEPENFAAFCALGDAGLELTRAELTNASLLVDWELVISNKPQRIVTGA